MSVPPVMKKLSLSIAALMLFLGIPAAWVWYTFAGPGYYAEFNDVKATLEGMPEVTLIRAWGNEDVTLEDIGAEIEIEDKGRIMFFALTRDSFKSTPVICLHTIGPYEFEYGGTGYVGVVKTATGEPVRSQFWGSAIDIGSGGEFAQFFPFKVKTVQDVIARYDDICQIIAKWPESPARQHFQNEEGTDYWFSMKRNPSALTATNGPAAGGTI
jgi:hypothetical protein